MLVSQVLSIRRPRRLAICLTIVALALVLVAYRLLTSNVRGHKATLLVKTLRGTGRNRHYDDNAVDVDDPLIHRQQQSFQRRHHHHEKALDNDEPALVDERTRIQPRGDSPLSLRDEAPDEEPGHDIPSVTDIPATKTDLLRGRVESVESPSDTLRENDDELSDISKNGHKEHDFGVNKDDVAFDSQQKEGEYVDVASSNRSSSASDVKFNDLMDDGAKAAEDLAETRQRDIVEENPQPTVQDVDIQLPLLSNNKTATGLFHKDIERVADFRKNVVLSVVDSGYVPIAVNFYRTSLVNVPLTNFLMVCTDRMAVKMLSLQGIACSFFDLTEAMKRSLPKKNVDIGRAKNSSKNSVASVSASDFGTADYYKKSNAKTAVILSALQLGYNVLIVDPDVMMFKDPFPYFNCTTCDAHFQKDREMYNSGFAFVRAKPGSLRLYQTAWSLYTNYQRAHDQIYLNMAINRLNPVDVMMGYSRRVSNLDAVRLQSLSVRLFPCGVYYFERYNRMFENLPPCDECVMAHNNYIGSVAAKVYRFKENLMWTIDDNQYYSNRTARYFTYENPRDFGLNSVDMEIEALKSALAISMVTGRLLILPTFRCCSRNCRAMKPGSRVHVVIDIPASTNTSRVVSSSTECSDPRHHCSLLSVLRLSKFDRVFGSRYREHTFLSNRLVPDVIKLGISPFSIFINTSDAPPPSGGNVTVVTPANRDRGATVSEVVRWFDERRDETVIRFHSLYGTTIDWSSDKALNFKLKRYFQVGFECSEYEQWEADQLDLAKMWPENKIN